MEINLLYKPKIPAMATLAFAKTQIRELIIPRLTMF